MNATYYFSTDSLGMIGTPAEIAELLSDLGVKVDKAPRPQPPFTITLHPYPMHGETIILGENNMFQMKDNQAVRIFVLALTAVDAKGNPTTVENLRLSVSDDTLATVTPETDATSGEITGYVVAAKGPLGSFQIQGLVDVQLGDGVSDVPTTPLDVTILPGNAVSIALNPSAPFDQPS